jgi:site-specific DNA recombinase
MRVAVYARYSSDNQREASIEGQVRECRAFIERQGWTLLQTYSDRALSGASMLRPGYQLLLQEAREGRFEVVVAEALDRLSRDQEDVAALYKRLRFAGVALVTLAEGEISDLHVGLKGTMNALNEPDRWVVKELPEFRIVDQELWDRVKARQAAMRCDTRPDVRIRPCDRRRPRYLLSGLVVCGGCGARYTKISADLFGCAAARNKGAAVCDNLRNVRRDRLEATVLDGLRHHLMEPKLFRDFCAEFTREINRQRGDQEGRREQLAAELRQVERRLRRMVEAIAEGVPARTLKDELLALEHRQDQLKIELAAAPEPEPTRLHPNLAEIYRAKVAALHEALADEASRDEAFELIRSLIDKVVVTPAEGDLHGELAGILGLCREGRRGRFDAETAAQIKVVAGAGFEPATFRL